jgi:hypothetical protein
MWILFARAEISGALSVLVLILSSPEGCFVFVVGKNKE